MRRLLVPLAPLLALAALLAAPAHGVPAPLHGHVGIVVAVGKTTFSTIELNSAPRPATHARGAPLFARAVRPGDRGPQVRAAQFVLTGQNPPAAYAAIHPFRGRKITGQFGKHTATAVLRARWLLGQPVTYRAYCRCKPGTRTAFDRDLFLILTGKRARPLGWIALASKRMALADRVKPSKASTPCAKRIVRWAQDEVGVREVGNNGGTRVHYYQSSTGAFNLAWCDSFVMKDYEVVGVWPYTRFAAVYLTVEQGRQHTLLRSTPTAGALVAYVRWAGRIRVDAGHIGVVERVTKDGFWTIEGNSHDAVTRHFRRFGDATVFIYPPCLTAKP